MKSLIRKIKYENISFEDIEIQFSKYGKEFICDGDEREVITREIYY